jgi:hypothetical protein
MNPLEGPERGVESNMTGGWYELFFPPVISNTTKFATGREALLNSATI